MFKQNHALSTPTVEGGEAHCDTWTKTGVRATTAAGDTPTDRDGDAEGGPLACLVNDTVLVGVGDHGGVWVEEGVQDPDPEPVPVDDLVVVKEEVRVAEVDTEAAAVMEAEGGTEADWDGGTPNHRVTLLGLVPCRSTGFSVNHLAAEGVPLVAANTLATAALVGTRPADTVTGTLSVPCNTHVAIKDGDPLGPHFRNVHQVEAACAHSGNPANAACVTGPPDASLPDCMGSPKPSTAYVDTVPGDKSA